MLFIFSEDLSFLSTSSHVGHRLGNMQGNKPSSWRAQTLRSLLIWGGCNKHFEHEPKALKICSAGGRKGSLAFSTKKKKKWKEKYSWGLKKGPRNHFQASAHLKYFFFLPLEKYVHTDLLRWWFYPFVMGLDSLWYWRREVEDSDFICTAPPALFTFFWKTIFSVFLCPGDARKYENRIWKANCTDRSMFLTDVWSQNAMFFYVK